jgi:hypothetical protein
VAAVQWLGHELAWDTPWLRLAALSSLIVVNIAMLLGYLGLRGGASAARHNRALAWLLCGIAVTYAAVLAIPALALRFGLPQGGGVLTVAALLALMAAAIGWRLLRTRAGADGMPGLSA